MSDNLKLWNQVEKTDPKHTKKAKIGGMSITSIKPQYQIFCATKQWGSYGETWGLKSIEHDFTITTTPITLEVKDYLTKETEKIQSILGLVGFKAIFFFPGGEFPITNSIKIFTDNKHSKIDDEWAKKAETDALTKALSKLGFNADIFMGRFDDLRYVEQVSKEFKDIKPEKQTNKVENKAENEPRPRFNKAKSLETLKALHPDRLNKLYSYFNNKRGKDDISSIDDLLVSEIKEAIQILKK